jgi:hypothetical protein
MKNWLRRLLIAVLLIALTCGVLYEMATHVGRGWLRGEAFYEGRPTSYWRARCDEWLLRFDSVEEAVDYYPPGIALPLLGDEKLPLQGSWLVPKIRPRPDAFWRQAVERFRPNQDRWEDDWPPRVLFGNPGAEEVLHELAREEAYRPLAQKALRYTEVYRRMQTPQTEQP